MTDKGWLEAGQLNVNESVLTSEETYEKIINIGIESLKEDIPIYNLEVKDYHTFYVGEEGVLVHNEYNMPNLDDIYKSYISEISDENLKVSFKEQLKRISESNDIELLREFDSKLQNISSGDTKALKKLLDNSQINNRATKTKKLNLEDFSKEVLETKPMNSPTPEKWLKKGGSISIDEKGIWTYTNKTGKTVSYPNGYPDFTKYTHPTVKPVEIEVAIPKNPQADFKAANEKARLNKDSNPPEPAVNKPPEGYTWHHHEDGKTMILVDEVIHREFRHIGGQSKINGKNAKGE